MTISAFLKQSHRDKEIIVIDNASDDGSEELIRQKFPEVKYMWLPVNIDIRAINIGVHMSTGDIIWRTDSDSYPENPDAFSMIEKIFNANENIHIISSEDIEVRNNNQIWEWYPHKVDKTNIPQDGYQAHIFPGTGAAIRKEVFKKIGGFWEFGYEEIDFCTRAIVAGFNVRYFPNIRTLHFSSPRDRIKGDRWVQISKQFIRYNWKYFPFWRALGRSGIIFFFQVFYGILSRIPISALIEGILAMNAVVFSTYRNERQVVPKNKLKDITLGTSILRAQIKFAKEIFKKKIQNWKKH